MKFPIPRALLQQQLGACGLEQPGRASIRELSCLVDRLEAASGLSFIRMEMGGPGLATPQMALDAEVNALASGVSSRYPSIEGVPVLKQEAARFLGAFLDIRVSPRHCLPTTGSTAASFLAFMTAARRDPLRQTLLSLEPGFPVHRLQLKALGVPVIDLNISRARAAGLRAHLDQALSAGNISTLLFSNPNNPTWLCLNESELEIIGELCNRHQVVVVEDLAYLTMDSRQDYSRPLEPPFQPTIARYAQQYLLLVSSSKLFSYAGERVAFLAVSPALYESRWPALTRYFGRERFGRALFQGASYVVSAGVNHSSQYGLAMLLKSASDGELDLGEATRIYAGRARRMKQVFLRHGFRLLYDRDLEQPLADGFYFTVSCPGLNGEQLVSELLLYGISAIPIRETAGSPGEGIRACVSQVDAAGIRELDRRLERFRLERSGRAGTTGPDCAADVEAKL